MRNLIYGKNYSSPLRAGAFQTLIIRVEVTNGNGILREEMVVCASHSVYPVLHPLGIFVNMEREGGEISGYRFLRPDYGTMHAIYESLRRVGNSIDRSYAGLDFFMSQVKRIEQPVHAGFV
ncbi:MAG: hypothetical protein HYW26_03260 [Candidatus Aenigmarchaeota archaeon]|nr:hypothetical protein [Candidatus Aenigmarchaeota archaeon]